MGNELHSRDRTFLDGIEFDHGIFISKDGKNTLSSRCCPWLSVLSSSDDEDIAPETINPFQIVNNTFELGPVIHLQGIRASSKDADLIPPPRLTPPSQTPSIPNENSSDWFSQLKEHHYLSTLSHIPYRDVPTLSISLGSTYGPRDLYLFPCQDTPRDMSHSKIQHLSLCSVLAEAGAGRHEKTDILQKWPEVRNAVPEVLRNLPPPVVISENSALDDTRYCLIPKGMRDRQMRAMY